MDTELRILTRVVGHGVVGGRRQTVVFAFHGEVVCPDAAEAAVQDEQGVVGPCRLDEPLDVLRAHAAVPKAPVSGPNLPVAGVVQYGCSP